MISSHSHSAPLLQPYMGLTAPMCLSGPTTTEENCTEDLIRTLQSMKMFESEEEGRKREKVLGKLSAILKGFVRRISLARNLPEAVANETGGKIFTFGSYRLGVHGPGADIDTLCVVPKFVQREDFFVDLHSALQSNPEVTELTAVAGSYVPVIKLVFDGIPIDLVFARLGLSSVPDDLELRDDNLLKNLDERCVRSLNGSRVTDEILRLVPHILTFRTALRCIKLWAKRRAIYSNVVGFLGGVGWALMVARVCQLYPNATASKVVAKFFRIMGQWNWPHPVLLKAIDDGPLQVRVWNPKTYPADRAHRMPIITPAYPSMCSTHNVTDSTLRIMVDEMNRAADITDRITVGGKRWEDLFEKHDFFSRYKYYLQVIASSDSMDNLRIWAALVESRLRHLVMKLENVELLQLAHPFMKGLERSAVCYSEQEAVDAGRGVFFDDVEATTALYTAPDPTTAATTARLPTNGTLNSTAATPPSPPSLTTTTTDQSIADEETEPRIPYRTVHTTTFYIGLAIEPRPPNSTAPRKLDLSWPTSEFTRMCKQWESYDTNFMGMCVRNIKIGQLPANVYDDVEQMKMLKRTDITAQQPMMPHPSKKRRSLTSITDATNGKASTVLDSPTSTTATSNHHG